MKWFSFLTRNQSPVSYSPSTTGLGPSAQATYMQFARAYGSDATVASAIDLRAKSAAEPHLVGRRMRRERRHLMGLMAKTVSLGEAREETHNLEHSLHAKGRTYAEIRDRLVLNGFVESLPNHPLVKLLNDPNPYIPRGEFWGTAMMDYDVAGNVYLLKARGGLGNISELWRLRPDRVRIRVDGGELVYDYTIGREKTTFQRADIIHIKTLNPLDEFYGMSPLMQLMSTVNIDAYMNGFLRKFFEQGGAGPGAILTVKNRRLTDEDKTDIRDRHRKQFGPGNFHDLMVLDNAESTYQQMGLNRGLRDALPKELSAENVVRIAMRYGIPGSILGILPGYESSSYANKRADWQVFWDITMAPLLSDFSDALNKALVPDYGGTIDEVLFDLSDIKALEEDVDKMHERWRKDLMSGVAFWEEARNGMGLDPDAEGTLLIPSNMIPVLVKGGKIEMPEPEPKQLPPPQDIIDIRADVFHSCGKLAAKDIIGNPELFCRRCNVAFRVDETHERKKVLTFERDKDGRAERVVEEYV